MVGGITETMDMSLSKLQEMVKGREAWSVAVHGVPKSQTRLSDFPFTFHFHALEKEMGTHSSVLAWRIPGTEELGGLPSMGLQCQTQLKRLSSSSIKGILPLYYLKNPTCPFRILFPASILLTFFSH